MKTWRKALDLGYGCQGHLEVQKSWGGCSQACFHISLEMPVSKLAYLQYLATRGPCRDEWRSRGWVIDLKAVIEWICVCSPRALAGREYLPLPPSKGSSTINYEAGKSMSFPY